jgi:hypothetical protein
VIWQYSNTRLCQLLLLGLCWQNKEGRLLCRCHPPGWRVAPVLGRCEDTLQDASTKIETHSFAHVLVYEGKHIEGNMTQWLSSKRRVMQITTLIGRWLSGRSCEAEGSTSCCGYYPSKAEGRNPSGCRSSQDFPYPPSITSCFQALINIVFGIHDESQDGAFTNPAVCHLCDHRCRCQRLGRFCQQFSDRSDSHYTALWRTSHKAVSRRKHLNPRLHYLCHSALGNFDYHCLRYPGMRRLSIEGICWAWTGRLRSSRIRTVLVYWKRHPGTLPRRRNYTGLWARQDSRDNLRLFSGAYDFGRRRDSNERNIHIHALPRRAG